MSLPAHKLRCNNLTVTIWRNSSENGPYYTVNPRRSYRKGDDIWRDTDSLGYDDLLTMAKLLDEAHSWISERIKADRKARRDAELAETEMVDAA